MPSRAAKVEKRRRQSRRDKAAPTASLAAGAAGTALRLTRAEQEARNALADQWGLGEIVPIRGGLQQTVVQVAGSAPRLGVTPWFDPGLAGRKPLDVALRETPQDWDPAEPLFEYVVRPGEWSQRATVVGVASAVDTIAGWLGWSGDRSLLPG